MKQIFYFIENLLIMIVFLILNNFNIVRLFA